jgi:transposase-like protein
LCPRWTGWPSGRSAARFLSQDERTEIADLRHAGLSIRQIAARLGRAPSTISRELRRNATASQGYRPFETHRRATARRARHHQRRIEARPELGQVAGELLAQRWSPQQISRQLRLRFPGAPGMWLVTRASTRPSTSPDRRCHGYRRWRPTAGPRCAPGVITGGRISMPTGGARGSSSPCSNPCAFGTGWSCMVMQAR